MKRYQPWGVDRTFRFKSLSLIYGWIVWRYRNIVKIYKRFSCDHNYFQHKKFNGNEKINILLKCKKCGKEKWL